MQGGFDPTRPVAPAFTQQTPHIDLSLKGKKKSKGHGLLRHPVLYAKMGPPIIEGDK